MTCLVVGGTGFLGHACVAFLRAAGHRVTILSRGQTTGASLPGVAQIVADRYGDLSALEDKRFDWVFDTCAYTPASVVGLLTALECRVDRYVLISSVSAYGTFETEGLCEEAAVPMATETDFDVAARVPREKRASAFAYGASYGQLKRACEFVAGKMLGERATSIRAGLLVGVGDYSDRLTWWVRRLDVARGDRRRVAVPCPIDRHVQMIDVQDVADFALRCAADARPGIWNVTGQPMPFDKLLDEIAALCGSDHVWVSVGADAIAKAGLTPWSDIPLMVPQTPKFRYFLDISTEKAVAAGLSCRPLQGAIVPLLAWDRGRRHIPLTCGMTAAQEASLLEAARR